MSSSSGESIAPDGSDRISRVTGTHKCYLRVHVRVSANAICVFVGSSSASRLDDALMLDDGGNRTMMLP
jgi:hypothetical protein